MRHSACNASSDVGPSSYSLGPLLVDAGVEGPGWEEPASCGRWDGFSGEVTEDGVRGNRASEDLCLFDSFSSMARRSKAFLEGYPHLLSAMPIHIYA
jgi:hypothetical protein